MKVIVLNGSPKGDLSVTMQYVHYIQKKFPEHELKILNIAQDIHKIENDPDAFDSVIREVASGDGVLWAFPLYIFAVIAQYKRFIELIFERNAAPAFRGRYAAALATSVKISDHTALNYINAVCDDLGMRYVDSFSAKMQDLKEAGIRENLVKFAGHFFDAIEQRRAAPRNFDPISTHPIRYQAGEAAEKLDGSGKKILVVTDSLENENLAEMIRSFRGCFLQEIELANLQEIDIKGGCQGCIRCGYNYECAYTGKDEFIDFYREKILSADIIVFAGSIRDRYLSARWKQFFDRSFFMTHTPMLEGKQVGFLISGPLRQIPNLSQILDTYFQYQLANFTGFATDEYENSAQIDEQIAAFAGRLVLFSKESFRKPKTFLGVGNWKVLRDEIWGNLRFPFLADYKAYKAMGIFQDFPQRNWPKRFQNLILTGMTHSKKIRKEIYSNQLKSGMIKDLKAIVEDPKL